VYNHHHHLSREKKKYVISSAIEIPPGVSMGGGGREGRCHRRVQDKVKKDKKIHFIFFSLYRKFIPLPKKGVVTSKKGRNNQLLFLPATT
jgi:hypothetical protein